MMQLVKKFVLPLGLLLLFNILLNWPFYFHGLIPFPGDQLVSFYFPWNSGGFFGFNPWTTHKEVVAADAIRQIYPWKELVIEQIKLGQWPLWNPYNFSGTPLLANLQSSVFSPVNLVFFVMPFLWAWLSLVIFLPVFFGFGFYFFLKSLKLSFVSSMFGALVAMNISYITLWEEQLIHIQSILFLPFMLLLLNICSEKKTYTPLLFIPLLWAFSIFGGHVQTVVYVSILVFLYALFKKIPLKWLAVIFGLGILAASVQLLPTVELFLASARDGSETLRLFPKTIIPLTSFATTLVPDFFGNPSTGNFWGLDYSNFETYFGTLAAFLALVGILTAWQKSVVKFFTILAIISLLFSATPLAYIWPMLHIPVLSSSNASRIILLAFISLTILSAIGIENILYHFKEKKRAIVISCVILILAMLGLIGSTFLVPEHLQTIALRNMILPVLVLFSGFIGIFLISRWPGKKIIAFVAILLFFGAATLEYVYFYTKYQPFSDPLFVFPNHPVFSFLQKKGGQNRFFGQGSAAVETNFATHFKVYAPGGYDSLYIKRYGEFLASSSHGDIPKSILRSDANLSLKENANRARIFDLLGIKFVLEKNDAATGAEIIGDTMIWHWGKFFAFKRTSALPRAFLADNFELPENSIKRFYAKDFDPKNTLLLEQKPDLLPIRGGSGTATIISYTPNKVVIKTHSSSPKLLFLSDAYFPGWQVFIDDTEGKIQRADYIFRAVAVPEGSHLVTFIYNPVTFKLGLIISSLSFGIIFLILCLKSLRRSS